MKLIAIYSTIGSHDIASIFKLSLYEMLETEACNPYTSWEQCYKLLLHMLPGHKLPLDPKHYDQEGRTAGWVELQSVLGEILSTMTTEVDDITTRSYCMLLLKTTWWMIEKKEKSDTKLTAAS